MGPVHVGVRSKARSITAGRTWVAGCCHLRGGLRRTKGFIAVTRTRRWMSLPAQTPDIRWASTRSTHVYFLVLPPGTLCLNYPRASASPSACLVGYAASRSVVAGGAWRNGSYTSPLTHSRCSNTASFRATATAARFFAFFPPRSHSRSP